MPAYKPDIADDRLIRPGQRAAQPSRRLRRWQWGGTVHAANQAFNCRHRDSRAGFRRYLRLRPGRHLVAEDGTRAAGGSVCRAGAGRRDVARREGANAAVLGRPKDGAGYRISYQGALSLSRDTWSAPGTVDHRTAVTDRRPSAAPYGAPSAGQVIVAWKTAGSGGHIRYSIGTAAKSGKLSWGAALAVPGAVTSEGPTVYSLLRSGAVFVTWKAAASHAIEYVFGSAKGSKPVTWGKVGTLPGAATTDTPAVAEVSTGSKAGRLYVLWKGLGGHGPIDRAWTRDPAASHPGWTAPQAFPAAVMTADVPAGQATGTGSSYPLLVVYRAQHGSGLLQVTLAADGKVTGPRKVPGISSKYGPALQDSTLAATAPDPGEVFYERMVHPCAGC